VNTQSIGVVTPVGVAVRIALGPGAFNSSSCGAVGVRPLAIVGAGSRTTLVHCGGTQQLLSTNDSVVVSGVTVTGAWVSLPNAGWSPWTDDDGMAFGGQGGGAVSVVWRGALRLPYATFMDVAFVNNSMGAVVRGQGVATAFVGGGAVYVTGGSGGGTAVVTLTNCTFLNNTAGVEDESENSIAGSCGGGACVALFGPATIVVSGVVAEGNAVTCGSGCSICA
jgi:hypothetical protein